MKMKKRMLRLLALFAAAGCTAGMSGCSEFGFGDQVMLRPPRATGDKAEIQTALEEQAGGSYTLKYPQKGQYRSAITTHTIGSDEYAIALYSTDNDSKLNIAVISGKDEKWECIGAFAGKGTGVDRIIFYDVNNDGLEDILVGWSNYATGRNTLGIYSVEGGAAREMTTDESYNEIIITDITGDKSDDIITISLASTQTGSSLRLLQYSDQDKRPMAKYAVDLDPEVKELTSVCCDKIDSGVKGIIIDGERTNSLLTTQIVYFDQSENELKNPLLTLSDTGVYINPTLRKDVITARDFDGDGIAEVPVVTPLSASPTDNAGAVCSLTSWKQLRINDGTLRTKLNTVIDYNDGYYFILPEAWVGNVTALSDPAKREVCFYVWDSKTGRVGDPLLSIQRYSANEMKKVKKDGYTPLDIQTSDGTDAIIAAKIFTTDKNKKLNIDKETLAECVKPL